MNDGMVRILADENLSWVASIYRWGINGIKGIQTIENPGLTEIIKGITAFGSEYFYIPVVLFVFWCVDEKKGLRLGLLMMLSAWVNGTFKVLLKQPRPYALDPSVGRAFEPSYGIPSGHAQLSLTFWVPFAAWISRPLSRIGRIMVWIGAMLIILVIGFTRLYLGLHFPTDLLAGWFLGGIILAIYRLFGNRIEGILRAGGIRLQMISVALIALGMNALGADRSFGGLVLGFGIGCNLMVHYFPFLAHARINGKKPGPIMLGTRYALGIAGAALIYLGLKGILPGEGSWFGALPFWGAASPYYELGRFARYGLLGLWGSAGAPWLFLRLGLANGN
ncbi:MAG: phosphatase PAP2 family protein [Treponema sp.]|jgi:membrane-associated phospholipid phosphatase|nr:phosphatase PAP2 family protein [Treponema sp.]